MCKADLPIGDDLIERDFTVRRPNRLQLAEIAEHQAYESHPDLCELRGIHLSGLGWRDRQGWCSSGRSRLGGCPRVVGGTGGIFFG